MDNTSLIKDNHWKLVTNKELIADKEKLIYRVTDKQLVTNIELVTDKDKVLISLVTDKQPVPETTNQWWTTSY